MRTVPTFLVVGAARSGTTAVVETLRRHPRVFVTQPKEPHYFALHDTVPAFTAPGDAETINAVSTTQESDYLALYPADASRYDALGEGSVSTFYYSARAIPEIRRLAPTVKIVIMLREPVERARSAYEYLISKGHESAGTLLEAVAAEDERIRLGYHHLWHYAAMSHYAPSLIAFIDTFGWDNVGVWFYDDLVAEQRGTVAEIARFVGVDPSPMLADKKTAIVNVGGTPRSPLLTQGLRQLASHEHSRQMIKRWTSFEFRERVRRLMVRKQGTDSATTIALAPLFRDDLNQVRDLLSPQRTPPWLAADERR